jgi:glycosyltransferase involved in cell wall biosynthesis
MANDKVLLINYDYPPGLSGVRRTVKFAKYLPEFGYDPMVLAAMPDERMPLDADGLQEVLAQGYPVVRTPSLDPFQAWRHLRELPGRLGHALPQRLTRYFESDSASRTHRRVGETARGPRPHGLAAKVGRYLSRWVLVPDDRVGWLPFAKSAADRIMHSNPVRYVFTSSYPHSAHLVGRYLKRRYRVKWIADFRDGWTQNPYFARWPTPIHSWIDRRLERSVLREADAVLTVSDPIARHLASIAGPDKVHVIPNGYDPDDAAGIEPIVFDKFTIAYTGTLFMQRSPENLFVAIRGLIDDHPAIADNFQLIFMSSLRPEHEAVIRDLGIGQLVHDWGLGPYREALRLQHSADALLVMEGEAPNAEIMLTQKIFEYLAAGKPVLAITPPGALASLVRRSRAGIVVPPDNAHLIKERLYELFTGTLEFKPDMGLITTFHRRELTRQLAGVLASLKK